jgi:hypothetical protein
MKKYLNEGHLGLSFGVAAFIYFIYTGLTRDKIKSDDDLVKISGTYLTHSFKDNTGFKNFTHQYYFWTVEYSNPFQISAGYLRLFNKKDFITNIGHGDVLVLSIPKRLEEKLNSEDNVFVTSIESNGKTYLNKNEVLEIERDLSTSNSDYYFGTLYLACGLFVYFRKRFIHS